MPDNLAPVAEQFKNEKDQKYADHLARIYAVILEGDEDFIDMLSPLEQSIIVEATEASETDEEDRRNEFAIYALEAIVREIEEIIEALRREDENA